MKRRAFLTGAVPVTLLLTACSRAADGGQPAPTTARQAFELAATGQGFAVGPMMAADTVYVFFDPQCPHCAALWEAGAEVRNRLRMVWLPVGLLSSTSPRQGAAILGAADPVAAMQQNEALVLDHKGGLEVKDEPPGEARARVEANMAIFRQLGADSVPMLYFRHRQTGQHGSHAGSLSSAQLLALVGA